MRHLLVLFLVLSCSNSDDEVPSQCDAQSRSPPPPIFLDWHVGVGCGFSGFFCEFLGIAGALEAALPGRVALFSGTCGDEFTGEDGLLFPAERSVVRRLQRRQADSRQQRDADRLSVVHGACTAAKVAQVRAAHSAGPAAARRHRVIARVMTEAAGALPAALLGCALAADEVWVPTAWHAKQFGRAGVPASKLAVVGEAVDGTLFARGEPLQRRRERLGHQAPFTFLSTFKWEFRKGWDVLLKAYWQAFGPADGVRLLLRAWKPSWERGDPNLAQQASDLARRQGLRQGDLARLEWLGPDWDPAAAAGAGTGGSSGSEALSREALRAALESADAFVLPTRGEGWGLPVAEAMTMGMPTLVTNFSGPTAFATATNALPIPVKHVDARTGLAEPDVDALARLMQRVVESARTGSAANDALGHAARRDMLEHWSPRAVAGTILARARAIMLRVEE